MVRASVARTAPQVADEEPTRINKNPTFTIDGPDAAALVHIPAGRVGLVTDPPGAGKSLAALTLAVKFVEHQHRSVVFTTEDGKDAVAQRLGDLAHKVFANEVDVVDVVDDRSFVSSLRTRCEQNGAGLLVLDPVSLGRPFAALAKWAWHTNTAVALVPHRAIHGVWPRPSFGEGWHRLKSGN